MTLINKPIEKDELRPEYDLRGGVRGKYLQQYREGTNVVLLKLDSADAFDDPKLSNRVE